MPTGMMASEVIVAASVLSDIESLLLFFWNAVYHGLLNNASNEWDCTAFLPHPPVSHLNQHFETAERYVGRCRDSLKQSLRTPTFFAGRATQGIAARAR